MPPRRASSIASSALVLVLCASIGKPAGAAPAGASDPQTAHVAHLVHEGLVYCCGQAVTAGHLRMRVSRDSGVLVVLVVDHRITRPADFQRQIAIVARACHLAQAQLASDGGAMRAILAHKGSMGVRSPLHNVPLVALGIEPAGKSYFGPLIAGHYAVFYDAVPRHDGSSGCFGHIETQAATEN